MLLVLFIVRIHDVLCILAYPYLTLILKKEAFATVVGRHILDSRCYGWIIRKTSTSSSKTMIEGFQRTIDRYSSNIMLKPCIYHPPHLVVPKRKRKLGIVSTSPCL